MPNLKNSLILLLCSASISFAQQNKISSRFPDSVPDEIIVKLKDKGTSSNGRVESISINDVIASLDLQESVLSSAELLPKEMLASPNARSEYTVRLQNTYRVKLNEAVQYEKDKIIEAFEQDENVEYAEPNFYVYASDFEPVSPIMDECEAEQWILENRKSVEKTNAITPNDPLYGSQTNVPLTNIDDVWETTTGDGNQIIAIIDTGVDTDHPDLADNIWINTVEQNGIESVDDDGNGYIDDINGWDFINDDNDPKDDNSHGTHVAGIAAAVGNNGIGIAGAAWNAQIIPIKVLQSSGRGDVATLATAVEYAYLNGANILNFSLGTYGESITLLRALEDAYSTSILVASAGNDGVKINFSPIYPAAYTFVIGVEDRPLPPPLDIGYTNYDDDGPLFSKYRNLLNYETSAPGTGILSSVPGGNYRAYTGTSMSAPLLSGALALYNEQKSDDSKEILFGNLIKTSGTYFDLDAAINVVPVPDLRMLAAEVIDTLNMEYVDGQADAGEIIELKTTVKNYWGATDSVFVAIEWGEFEDQSKATFIDSVIFIGSVGAYGTLESNAKALKIQLASTVNNNVDIVFKFQTWSGKAKNYFNEIEYVLNVKNAIKFSGLLTNDFTLKSDKKYLVRENLVIGSDAILTIKPGAILEVSSGVNVTVNDQAQIIAIGTRDSLITIKAEESSWGQFSFGGSSNIDFQFVKIQDFYGGFESSNGKIHNCLFIGNRSRNGRDIVEGSDVQFNNIIDNNFFGSSALRLRNSYEIRHNNVVNNNAGSPYHTSGAVIFNNISGTDTIGNVLNNIGEFLVNANGSYGSSTQNILPVYLGSSDSLIVRNGVNDFFNSDFGSVIMAPLDITGFLKKPDSMAHGIVWKVLVNGLDAQDEYDILDPIGVGTHRFDIYFNRPMDTLYAPQVSMGVREPFNQSIFTTNGDWSDDSLVYTVFHTLGLKDVDGINRIRVQGAKDTDLFEIPVEASRFNVLVQAAGSASTGFTAIPGLGKIELEWEAPDEILEDLLGYNMYRYEPITDSTFTDPVQINDILVTDTTFVDFDVLPAERYYYKYTAVRTNFTETDSSKTVSGVPLTADMGDANGDFAVNVMDVIHEVNYVLGTNPTPFIYEAADINADATINVLDIVGTVNIILNPGSRIETENIGIAKLYWEEDRLYMETDQEVSGFQLAFTSGSLVSLSEEVHVLENTQYDQNEEHVVMAFSFDNRTLPAGKTYLLSSDHQEIVAGVISDNQGISVPIEYLGSEPEVITSLDPIHRFGLTAIYPNPVKNDFTLKYAIPEKVDRVSFVVFDASGKVVYQRNELPNTSGYHHALIDGSTLETGMYIGQLTVMRGGYLLYNGTSRIVKQ